MSEQKREVTEADYVREIEVIGPDGVRSMKKRDEVTEADCVAEINDAIKDMNPYQKELFFQRLDRAFAGGPKRRRKSNVIYADFGRRNDRSTVV